MKTLSIEAAHETSRSLISALSSAAPYVHVSTAKFAGTASIFITISLDPKENWAYGILENSLYAKFVIHPDGKLSLFSGGARLAKFRKCNALSVANVTEKIKNWINESNKMLDRN